LSIASPPTTAGDKMMMINHGNHFAKSPCGTSSRNYKSTMAGTMLSGSRMYPPKTAAPGHHSVFSNRINKMSPMVNHQGHINI